MDQEMMFLSEVQRKSDIINSHRQIQKSDVVFRHRIQRFVMREINEKESALRKAFSNSQSPHAAATIARTVDELQDLRGTMHQLILDDGLATGHWRAHFSLPENRLTHNERKFLRSFNPTTALREIPQRTKSPVERSHDHAERLNTTDGSDEPVCVRSSSIVLRGSDASAVRVPSPMRLRRKSALSSSFRLAESGSHGDRARKMFSPHSNLHQKTPIHSIKSMADTAKALNSKALVLLQKNMLRDAKHSLDEAHALLKCRDTADKDLNALCAVTLCNLATFYRRSHQLPRAMASMRECVEIETEAFGVPAPSSILNLGALHLEMGDVSLATSTVESLLEEINHRKDQGQHVSRHIFHLCEEHLATCCAVSSSSAASPLFKFSYPSYDAVCSRMSQRSREGRSLISALSSKNDTTESPVCVVSECREDRPQSSQCDPDVEAFTTTTRQDRREEDVTQPTPRSPSDHLLDEQANDSYAVNTDNHNDGNDTLEGASECVANVSLSQHQ